MKAEIKWLQARVKDTTEDACAGSSFSNLGKGSGPVSPFASTFDGFKPQNSHNKEELAERRVGI